MGRWHGDIESLRQLSLVLKAGTAPRSREDKQAAAL
jgi:hypothetical protein